MFTKTLPIAAAISVALFTLTMPATASAESNIKTKCFKLQINKTNSVVGG